MKTSTKIGGATGAVMAVIMATAAIVQPWEGRELRAYQDIVGVWTICDGDTNNVRPGMVETAEGCDVRLYANLKRYQAELRKCLTAPLPVKTEAAFVSWTYNVGWGAACKSTLVRRANSGDLVGACLELMKWNRAGGRVVRGLTNRREAERILCLQGVGEGR
jgi:GH24 family phage-related lysozyme (muramidase)